MGASKIGDALKIGRGSLLCNRVMRRGEQLWPKTAYYAQLFVSWVYGGQYAINSVPASGGSAVPTWTLKVYRVSDDVEVYSTNVIPSITLSTYSGFGFSNNTWTATSRGRNGDQASGTDAPTSDSTTRTCDLTATYSGTYDNKPISAQKVVTMTQLKNEAHADAYTNLVVALDRYDTTGSPAPAYETVNATITATMDQLYTYDSGETYTYQQALKTNSFNLSAVGDWVTFQNQSSAGATVKVWSRGTDFDEYRRSTTIRATLGMSPSIYDEITIYQAPNVYTNEVKQYTGASTSISPDPILATDRYFTVFGYLDYQYKHEYSSGAWDPEWMTDSESATPVIDAVTMDGASYYDFSGNVVSIQENQSSSQIEYETESHITDPDGYTWSNLTASATQEGVSQQVTFGTPRITDFYYPDAGGYNIPASGGTVYPVIEFEQDYYINGVYAGTLQDSVDDGTNSGTMTDGVDISSPYTISYRVGGQASSTGAVSASSRGTNPDPDGTTEVTIASNCYASVTASSLPSSNSSSETVTQQANHEESTEEFGQTYSLVDLDFVWNSHNAKALSAGETGYLTWAECREYYYIRTWYTSGGHVDGQTQYYRDIDADASESASWLTTSGYYVTAEKNGKNGSERSATVYAVYGGNTLGFVTVTQAETISWYTLESTYSSGLTFTAAGGSQTVTFKGYRNYDNGDSPTETSSPGVTVTYDGDIANRISNGGTQGRTITANNLGSDPYDSVDTYYTFQWTLHSEATCTIPVTQGPNEPGNFGTVSFPAPGSTADPGGDSINLAPTCPFTWTSGSSGTMMGDGFDFEYVVKANDTYRTYGFTGHYADFGSLGTNTRSFGNTTIRAILKADSSKTATAIIQEEANGPTSNHLLDITWSNLIYIPGYGGSLNVGITEAKYKTQYDSGDWDEENLDSTDREHIAASIQLSDSSFTKTYTTGTTYVVISAPYNPDSTSARDCVLTAYYGSVSDTDTVTQKKCPFDVDYVESTQGGQRIRTAYIYNTDDEQHRYGYTKETSVGGVVDTTTGTAGPIIAGGNQNMGAVPLVSGYTNTISIDIDTVEDYSGGSWVSHNVIRS